MAAGNANVKIPALALTTRSGAQGVSILPSLSVIAEGGAYGGSALPVLTLTAEGTTGFVGSGNFVLPGLLIEASGGAYASVAIPGLTVSASGQVSGIGRLNRRLPAITLTSNGYTGILGNLSVALPWLRISSSGQSTIGLNLSRRLGAVTISASGLSGGVGGLSRPIPALTLAGNSYWQRTATANLTLPALRLVSLSKATVAALSLNIGNFALSKYTSFPYTDLFVHDGKLIGMDSTGIYELTGTDDPSGVAIPWKLRIGELDLKANRLRQVWLSGILSGDVKMVVETPDGERYEYGIEPVSNSENEFRVKVGKGIKSRYVTIELFNEESVSMSLDELKVFGKPGSKVR